MRFYFLHLSEPELNPKLQEKIDEALATIDANHPDVTELIEKLMKIRGNPKIAVSAEEEFNVLYDTVCEIEENNQQMKHSHIK